MWLKTGCLITADGSNDDKIAPEGLPNYQLPPPSQYLESAVQLPESNGVEFEELPPPDTIVANDDNSLPDGQEPSERIDREEDRIIDNFVGRRIKALYENGWFVDETNYFNKSLEEYRVSYEDDTEDYISLEDVDGVEVQLL